MRNLDATDEWHHHSNTSLKTYQFIAWCHSIHKNCTSWAWEWMCSQRHSCSVRWPQRVAGLRATARLLSCPGWGSSSGHLTTAAPLDRANLTGLVLGCIEANFCNKICAWKEDWEKGDDWIILNNLILIFRNFRNIGNFLICFRKFDWKDDTRHSFLEFVAKSGQNFINHS